MLFNDKSKKSVVWRMRYTIKILNDKVSFTLGARCSEQTSKNRKRYWFLYKAFAVKDITVKLC